MKPFRKVYFGLLYILPAILFFSYYPVIRLGSNSSMNYELSLPLIWLVIFDIIAFVGMVSCSRPSFNRKLKVVTQKALKRPSATNGERNERSSARNDGSEQACRVGLFGLQYRGISDRKFFLFALFPLYATLSIFWSSNHTRAILTAGIIWLLFFAIFAIVYLSPLFGLPSKFRPTLLKAFFISSIIICVVCWGQCILDVCGIAREHTLLCVGCVSQTFGFPHPSGFAIEPQFMGNLLLAPTLLSLWILTKPKIRVATVAVLAFLFSSTLFLTFSRGAIYAFAVALVILLIFTIAQHKFRPALIFIPVTAFIFTLIAQGIFSVVGPTHETFVSGVTKSIHQLSLGIIDLRPQEVTIREEVNQALREYATEHPSSLVAQRMEEPKFDGYIAESTDIRLGLNSIALQTWFAAPGANLRTVRIGHDCPHNSFFNDTCASYTVINYNRYSILFGVGLGSAGTAMHRAFPEVITTPKEIVQNQPISLLLELGLIGIILIVFSLLLAFCPQIFPAKFVDGRSATTKPTSTFWQHPALPLLLSLIVAYLVTLQFFSGLPNALQIYLLPPLLYFALQGNEKPIALSK